MPDEIAAFADHDGSALARALRRTRRQPGRRRCSPSPAATMPNYSTPPSATASCAGRKSATCACASSARWKRACSRSTASCSAGSTKAPGRRRRAAIPGCQRPMRRDLGLDPPERRIGLSAHDFAQALGAPEVILTRAAKLAGAPTVTSRFVQRIAALAGERWNDVRARGDNYLALARALDHPARGESRRAAGAEAAARGAAVASSPSPPSKTGCAIPTRSTRAICCACRRSIRSTRRPARATAAPSSMAPSATSPANFAAGLPADPLEELRKLGEKRFAPLERLSGSARVLVAALHAHRAVVRGLGRRAPRRDPDAACRN